MYFIYHILLSATWPVNVLRANLTEVTSSGKRDNKVLYYRQMIYWNEVALMANKRDDFSSATKELLANRVGRKCSNPMCRKLTCGANENPEKITNIGVAAHICAAAKGGPRYDANMTPQERKSFENGIWLCQSCSKLIDTDTTRYTKDTLQSWKRIAEEISIMEVEAACPAQNFDKDKELVQFFVQCFDRPAFPRRYLSRGADGGF